MTRAAQGAMDRALEICEHRDSRATELARQGKKVIGYFCCYTPVELLTALDLVPFRIHGSVGKPLRQADQYLETIMCPFVRSCFDLGLSGEYDFLSGVVVPHTCDAMHRIYDIWKYYMKPPFSHCLTVPHMTHEASFEYFRTEIEILRRGLEDFAGRPASEEDLTAAIGLHNRSRALLRELYELRKAKPPPVSGVEAAQVVLAGMALPVREAVELTEDVVAEARSTSPTTQARPRLLMVGSEVDDVALVRLIEDCGATVVMDDLCTGSRSFWKDVDASRGVMNGLAESYLGGITCPCTYRSGKAPERFAYLADYIRDWGIDGVLLYAIRFCDTYQLDVPEIKAYVESMGLPVLYLEDDYILPPSGQWKTRIEAFLETIEAATKE